MALRPASQSTGDIAAIATAVAAAVPDAAAVQAECQDAIDAKVADLTIPDANNPYNGAQAAIDAKVATGIIPRADLSVTTATISGGASGDLVAAVGGQVVKVYAFEVFAPTSMDGTVRFYDGAAADIGGSATALHDYDRITVGLTQGWVHPFSPKPLWTTSTGKGISIDNAGGAGSVKVTVFYKQE
jgi:hypothetical protein